MYIYRVYLQLGVAANNTKFYTCTHTYTHTKTERVRERAREREREGERGRVYLHLGVA